MGTSKLISPVGQILVLPEPDHRAFGAVDGITTFDEIAHTAITDILSNGEATGAEAFRFEGIDDFLSDASAADRNIESEAVVAEFACWADGRLVVDCVVEIPVRCFRMIDPLLHCLAEQPGDRGLGEVTVKLSAGIRISPREQLVRVFPN